VVGWVERLRRFAYYALLIGLLPAAGIYAGTGEAPKGLGWRTLLKPILWPLVRWYTRAVHRKICNVAEMYCYPVLAKEVKKGFVRLGSANPQTVWDHVCAVMRRFYQEAQRRGLSRYEISLGLMRIIIHELDEVVRGDRPRWNYPHRRAKREQAAKLWQIEEGWIPPAAGDVSPRWRADYEESRPVALIFLRKNVGWFWAWILIRYYDAFHVGMDRVSILLRDCHYAETVEEGLNEEVEVHHFWLEANAGIADPFMRAELTQIYEASRGELGVGSAKV